MCEQVHGPGNEEEIVSDFGGLEGRGTSYPWILRSCGEVGVKGCTQRGLSCRDQRSCPFLGCSLQDGPQDPPWDPQLVPTGRAASHSSSMKFTFLSGTPLHWLIFFAYVVGEQDFAIYQLSNVGWENAVR